MGSDADGASRVPACGQALAQTTASGGKRPSRTGANAQSAGRESPPMRLNARSRTLWLVWKSSPRTCARTSALSVHALSGPGRGEARRAGPEQAPHAAGGPARAQKVRVARRARSLHGALQGEAPRNQLPGAQHGPDGSPGHPSTLAYERGGPLADVLARGRLAHPPAGGPIVHKRHCADPDIQSGIWPRPPVRYLGAPNNRAPSNAGRQSGSSQQHNSEPESG